MTEDQVKLACELGGIKAWMLNLDTGHTEFEGNDQIRHGIQGDLEDRYKTIHPDDAEEMRRRLAALSDDAPDYDFEYRGLSKDSNVWRWIRVKGKLAPGTRILYGVAMDITEQKLQDLRLRGELSHAVALKSNIRELLDEIRSF